MAYCSNCGAEIAGRFCSNCGFDTFTIKQSDRDSATFAVKLSNQIEAQTVNGKFYSTPKKAALAQRKADLDAEGAIYCPKCLSVQFSSNKKGFGIGKAIVGAVLTGGIGLTAGNIGAKKVRVTCLKCGHSWLAGR